jgi:hypothetical protein
MDLSNSLVLSHCDCVSTNRFGAAAQVLQQIFIAHASVVFLELELHSGLNRDVRSA